MVVGVARVVTFVKVVVVPEVMVVTGGGVERVTPVVVDVVGLTAVLDVGTEVPPVVDVVPVGLTEVKLVGEIVICPLVVGAVLLSSDTS